MKILMLAPLFYPHIGGVEKHVQKIAEKLVHMGHSIIILTLKHKEDLLDIETVNGLKIYRFPSNRLPAIWQWLFMNQQIIKKADVIHCHDFSAFIYWCSPFRFIFPLKPIFVTFHGYEGIIPIPKNILFMRKVTEFLTKGNICIGDFIPKWYGTKADFISYGGVNEPVSTRNIVPKNSAVFIGRLEKDTGILAYINAVKILKKIYSVDIEMTVCGGGSLQVIIEKIIREDVLKIKLCGFVENPIDYLIKSKFAFVSGYLSILEAMINKKLVFSIYENELKKDYLTLIPNSKNIMVIVSSSEELANELLFYHNNPKKAEEKINNAYNFAKEQTWEKLTDTYLKIWGAKNEQSESLSSLYYKR